jgi:hypothetical protein
MQYALVNPASAGNSLPTPPFALKKVRAIAPRTDISANSKRVFVTGIIDERGMPRDLRAISAPDVRAQAAVAALSQWEFLPAQLDGKPVASKVLIGVNVIPPEGAGKQY